MEFVNLIFEGVASACVVPLLFVVYGFVGGFVIES